MSKSYSYNEIMEKIEVTDEMRNRILNNISAQEIRTSKKIIRFPKWSKIASVAACIALVFISGAVVKNFIIPDNTPDIDTGNPTADMVECGSASELSLKAGFSVNDITYIPFDVTSTSYTWCWNEFAQVEYNGSENALLYRKIEGNTDISGDYSEYAQINNKTVDGAAITLKGNDDKYSLAIWQYGGYSYSVYLNQGVDFDSMLKIVESAEF